MTAEQVIGSWVTKEIRNVETLIIDQSCTAQKKISIPPSPSRSQPPRPPFPPFYLVSERSTLVFKGWPPISFIRVLYL